MSVQSAANQIYGIAGALGGGAGAAIAKAEAAKEQLSKIARYIAKREFMYKLRGDNDQIVLEQIASLRDAGAKELSKSA